MINAGADWVDEEVVIDGNQVSSRRPSDLPAFAKAFVDLISKGRMDAITETLEVLANPDAMKAIQSDRDGTTEYISLDDRAPRE